MSIGSISDLRRMMNPLNRIKKEWKMLNLFINVKLIIVYLVFMSLYLSFIAYIAYLVIKALKKYIGD